MSRTSAGRLSRLLALLPWLNANNGISIEEAAVHFGVTAAEIEKDLWLLILCGLPGYGPDQLVDIQFWDDARIHVLDPQGLQKPLRLSGDEAMSLLVALRLLAQVPGPHDRQALHSATEKLEQAVAHVAGLDDSVIIDSGNQQEVVDAIDAAVEEGRLLEIRYSGATRDEITDRVVEPLSVTTVDGRAYLEAECHQAGAVRTFRVDRILRATVGAPIETKMVTDASGMADGVGGPSAVQVRLRIERRARWALDVHPIEVIEDHPDGVVVGDIAVRDPDWLVRLVLSMAGSVAVLGPAEIRVAVMNAADEALKAYADPA
jgi:proteasome accessory factor C